MMDTVGIMKFVIGVIFLSVSSIVHAQDVKEITNISDFTNLELNNSTDIRVTIGDEYLIRLIGDEDRFDNIDFNHSGDTLEISTRKRFGFFNRKSVSSVNIEIVMPDLEEITLNSSGDAEVIGLDNDELSINIHSSGDLYVTGKSENLKIEVNSSGDVEIDEIISEDVEIEINGSGNVEFDDGVCDRLYIEIDGSGDVDARDLACSSAEIEVDGSGNSRIFVTEKLVFDGDGSGRLDVFGSPKEVIDNAAKRRSKIRIR